MICLIP